MVASLLIPRRIWVETQDAENLACDVIAQMENGAYYTALFVTLPYLARQMDLGYEVSKQLPDAMPVRYATLEIPHIVVSSLDRDSIEDTIENLIALDTFENLFTQISDEEGSEQVNRIEKHTSKGKLATAEVAAVVFTEVLHIIDVEMDDTTESTVAPITVA